jgi:hypothetical protein
VYLTLTLPVHFWRSPRLVDLGLEKSVAAKSLDLRTNTPFIERPCTSPQSACSWLFKSLTKRRLKGLARGKIDPRAWLATQLLSVGVFGRGVLADMAGKLLNLRDESEIKRCTVRVPLCFVDQVQAITIWIGSSRPFWSKPTD